MDKQAIAYSGKDHVELTEEVLEVLTDDELAFILSHEVAHLKYEHAEREKSEVMSSINKSLDKLSEMGSGLKRDGYGLVARSVAKGVGIAIIAGASYLQARFLSREHEDEADRSAVEIAHRAGYDTAVGSDAIEKLTNGLYSDTFLQHLISTHPDSYSRFNNLKRYAIELKSKD